MSRVFLLVIVSVLFLNISYAQKLKKHKTVDPRTNTFELYYVLAENPKIKQGEYLYRYKGKVQVKGQFENNMPSGQWIYTPGGDLKIEGNFEKGKKEGEWQYYQKDKIISSLNYKNGLLHGEVKGYYETGELASELNYNEGRITGNYKSYYKNGQVKELTAYQDGKINGTSRKFDEEGNVLYKIEYKEESVYSIEINTDEELLFGGDLKEGNGQIIQYDVNGEGKAYVKRISNFKDGKLHGQIKAYNHKEELFYRGQYLNGYMVGMWNFYINDPEKSYSEAYRYSDSLTIDTTKWFLADHKKIDTEPEVRSKFSNKDENSFRYHIQSNLMYPKSAQETGVSGRVLTQFKVNKLGLVKEIEVISSDDRIFDEEAIRVIKSSPLWTPGFKDQLPVTTLYTFPIVFQLR